jgi:S-formylglutathione hydrolase FrmB
MDTGTSKGAREATMAPGHVHHIARLPSAVTSSVGRVGWLENWRLAAALLAVAVALLAGWVAVAVRARRAGRHPRHPVRRRLALGGLVTLVALLGVGVGVNSYVGYAPDVSALVRQVPSLVGVRNTGGGSVDISDLAAGSRYGPRVVAFTLSDPANRIPAGRTWVYLPPGYDDPANAGRRYPVVYLIGGYPGSSYDWFGAGQGARAAAVLQQEGLIRPMILVTPDASAGTLRDTECLDSTTGGPRLETFLTRTVVAAVDGRFRTLPDRNDRAIGGVSAGAYCALNLGLRHQAGYGAVLSMEPFGDPGRNAIRTMLGGNAAAGAANSPSDYVRTIPLRYPQRVFLSAATNDPRTRPTATWMGEVLAQRGVYVGLSLATGYSHSWREARAELPYALMFATAAAGGRTLPAPPLGAVGRAAADPHRTLVTHRRGAPPPGGTAREVHPAHPA